MAKKRRWRSPSRGVLLGGLSLLLTGLLAVVINFATAAVPPRFAQWTDDPVLMWGAVGLLLVLMIVIGAVIQWRAAGEPVAESVVGPAELAPVHNLPPRNPAFVGRNSTFERIEAEFTGGPVAVVAMHGLGGVGKSAIALELAHRGHVSGRYSIVWWIRAEAESTLVEDLGRLAPTLGLKPVRDQARTMREVRAALQGRADWLIVFDNVSKPEDVRPWLVGGPGATLITSRFRGWEATAVQVDLDLFTREESLAYLARAIHRYRVDTAGELAWTLGDLPLALAQAAAYLDLYDLPIESYLVLYQDSEAAGRLLAQRVDGYPASVATTWLLHHEHLATEEPAALELLRLCAFLDPEDVDLDLLLSESEHLPAELAAAVGVFDRERVVGSLVRTSLVARGDEQHRIRVHRLVAQVTRLQLGADVRTWAQQAVALVNALFPPFPGDPGQWTKCAELAAHASAVIEHAEGLGASDAQAKALLARLGVYLQSQVTGGPSQVRSAYSRQIERIAPNMLTGRDHELATLAAFSTSDDEPGYLWLRAGPWSGKTALLSWFALHPPERVTVVSFFVTGRFAGQADRAAFVNTVLEQLLTITGLPFPVHPTAALREAALLSLLDEVATACRARSEHLLLIVDGMDEDRGLDGSIAALLPTHTPPGLRIVVTARPNPPLPADLPAEHPLRTVEVVQSLPPSAHARAMRADVEQELKQLLNGSEKEHDLLGLLAAARSGLTTTDLAELTGLGDATLSDLLSSNERSLVRRRRGETYVYLLGHEVLQSWASELLGARLENYRRRLWTWARGYGERGWPEETPEYLLIGFPSALLAAGHAVRLVHYVTDASRHDRMRRQFGDDSAALAEVDAALVAVSDDKDLVALLAARRATLTTSGLRQRLDDMLRRLRTRAKRASGVR
ncbi:NB-ARC domain-containing protein [Umezawaea sp. Da 62-37]|uniref:DUF7779 domain-containing protein n=1 Tax=Umezawaea sp. Da 62-37 TaxID=3075927 RepID=UPI0028F70640|nr:NB-ARC domain-containing protein [Umezawaea sp. Da 62-37]WNV85074.1 NB-ARC domain-containing protein [Umezawaea sp. Da 62-37]